MALVGSHSVGSHVDSSNVGSHVCSHVGSHVDSQLGSLNAGSHSVSHPSSPTPDSHPGNLSIRTKSRSDSSCSSSSDVYSYYTEDSSNGSISSPSIENYDGFQVIDNPTDANTATRLVPRSRLEELEYINENISAIILEAINNFRD